jgi:hypothetical protein
MDMICFAEPGLTEDLYIVHKEEFSITCKKKMVVSLRGLGAKMN